MKRLNFNSSQNCVTLGLSMLPPCFMVRVVAFLVSSCPFRCHGSTTAALVKRKLP